MRGSTNYFTIWLFNRADDSLHVRIDQASMPVRSSDTYLFIDGEYLRRIFKDAMQNILLCSVTDEDIDYAEIKRQADAKRAFFYDCIDDEQQHGESDADFQNRIRTQEAFFSKLGGIKGFHVRQGSLLKARVKGDARKK
jgi:hypothetical protein